MAGKIFIASAFAAFFRKNSHNIPSANELAALPHLDLMKFFFGMVGNMQKEHKEQLR